MRGSFEVKLTIWTGLVSAALLPVGNTNDKAFKNYIFKMIDYTILNLRKAEKDSSQLLAFDCENQSEEPT